MLFLIVTPATAQNLFADHINPEEPRRKTRYIRKSTVFSSVLLALAISSSPTNALKRQIFQKRYDPNLEEVRILSIDGGGTKGVIPLTILNQLEIQTGKPICENFDLLGGTSVGCILSTGLSAPKDPTQKIWQPYSSQELLDIFQETAPKIFSKMRVGSSLYDSSHLEELVDKFLGNTTFSQSLIPRVGLALDETTLTTRVFSSEDQHDYLARDVVLASSAVPILFPKVQLSAVDKAHPIYTLLDGASLSISNDPAADIIAKTREIYPKARRFSIVSLGNGITNKRNDLNKFLGYLVEEPVT